MKKLWRDFIFGKNAKVSAIFAIGIFLLVGLGCFGGKSSGSKPIPAEYVGAWTGTDGSTITIRGDGKGDYKSGGTSVDGGTVEIDDAKKELSITFFNIGPTKKIDSPPSGDQMTLDGIVYKRNGGSTTSIQTEKTTTGTPESKKSLTTDGAISTGDAPSDSEVETLVKATLADFTEGVENEDFITLYTNSSKDFQASYTAPQIKNSFTTFIAQKDKVIPILNSADDTSAKFTEPPRVRMEKGYKILVAEGEFPTRPNTIKFKTEYEFEKGKWKLLTFNVRL